MTAKIRPAKLSALDVAFPASVEKLLPKWTDIPEEFRQERTHWNRIVSRWFFEGLRRPLPFTFKPGVDERDALNHLRACLGSFEPKHEHKEAGCAYLLSLWCDSAVAK